MSEQRCETSQLVSWYREFLDHGKSAAFVSCVATRYDNATLIRLTGSSDFESRRASVLALGMLGGRSAVSPVGRCMTDDDRCVRLVAELAFADICRREFGDAARRELELARRHLDGSRHEKAEEILLALTAVWPEFAEAWYVRALVRCGERDFVQAIGHARRTVTLNPYHFSAVTLEGRMWLELDAPSRALASFKKSMSINPSQIVVQNYVDVLSRRMRSGK